jgi:hypothetical protein
MGVPRMAEIDPCGDGPHWSVVMKNLLAAAVEATSQTRELAHPQLFLLSSYLDGLILLPGDVSQPPGEIWFVRLRFDRCE